MENETKLAAKVNNVEAETVNTKAESVKDIEERATVTFEGGKHQITIDFKHNKTTGMLDFRPTIYPPFKEGEDMDLNSFLADSFLGMINGMGKHMDEDPEVEK